MNETEARVSALKIAWTDVRAKFTALDGTIGRLEASTTDGAHAVIVNALAHAALDQAVALTEAAAQVGMKAVLLYAARRFPSALGGETS